MYANDTHFLVFNGYKDFCSMRLHNSSYGDCVRHIHHKEWITNPHCRSLIANKGIVVDHNRAIDERDRYIDFEFKDTVRYSEDRHYASSSHHGQRKLLISEIEFMTKYSHLSENVLYIGAAPGTHITMLSELFPRNRFILYDPNNFSMSTSDRIIIQQKMFTSEEISKYYHMMCNILLISDIRTSTDDESIIRDNEFQKMLVKNIKPVAASLKFRMPFNIGRSYCYSFLDGKYYLQPWAGRYSSETRVFWDMMYSHDKLINLGEYEDHMYWHNLYRRHNLYDNDLSDNIYMDKCYDCSSESHILSNYIKSFGLDYTVNHISNRITAELYSPCI